MRQRLPPARLSAVLVAALTAPLAFAPAATRGAPPGAPPPAAFGEWLGWGAACNFLPSNEAILRQHLGTVLNGGLNLQYDAKDMDVVLKAIDGALRLARANPDERDGQCNRLKSDQQALGSIGAALSQVANAAPAAAPPAAAQQPTQQAMRQPAAPPTPPPGPAATDPADAARLTEGEKLRAEGRYAEADALTRKALSDFEKKYGPDHPLTATAANNLAELERVQGRFDAADKLFRRALAAMEKAYGADDPALAPTLGNLANLERTRGRFASAETLLKRALAIREKQGPNNPDIAATLNGLAVLATARDRYDEAEPLYRRALSVLEAAHGDSHPNIAATLNNLANLYRLQGKLDAAQPLFQRSLRIAEATRGANHPETAAAQANLAQLYLDRGKPAEASPLFRKSLAALEGALGPDHPDVATALNNLAAADRAAGRLAEADQELRRAVAILEKATGPASLDTATALANLASLDLTAGRAQLAVERLGKARDARQALLGADHPDVIAALYGMALAERAQNRPGPALEQVRQAAKALEARGARLRSDQRQQGTVSTKDPATEVVLLHLALLGATPNPRDAAIVGEGFRSAQGLRGAKTSSAVSRMAARFAAGTNALAATIRQRQDLIERFRTVDALLVRELSKPGDQRKDDAKLRAESEQLGQEIDRIDRELATRFPEYAELADPRPLSVADTQALLGPGEALLLYALDAKASHLWVVRGDGATYVPIAAGEAEIARDITALRQAVDPTQMRDPGNPPAFPIAKANEVYRRILGGAETQLQGIRHVIVVPDGALQSLPFSMLVDSAQTSPPAYLLNKYAFTTLPAVSSLRALRKFAQQSKAAQPFVGFGDPILAPQPTQVAQRGLTRSAPATLFREGALANVAELRKLPGLPETADELRTLARLLKADEKTALFLRQQATERRVRQMKLSQYRVLAFATHGLMSGEFPGVVEPALVLTPPARASEQDDGVLTASEIAQLSLDAEWTILSACNTAAADGTPGAEGLSGLARAFFYAGTRALLVSHWQVESMAAARLTTVAIQQMAANPKLGRAEALRQSMLAMINDKAEPRAHPLFWAPFVVVGEGGAPR